MRNTMIRTITTFFFTLMLFGCGGESSSPTPEPSSTAPAQIPAPSTALADNPLSANTEFNQFNEYLAQIPDKSKIFNSSEIYIKLYTADGNTLYLGRLKNITSISIYLPNHIKSVMIDMFSTDPQDPQITEEITL